MHMKGLICCSVTSSIRYPPCMWELLGKRKELKKSWEKSADVVAYPIQRFRSYLTPSKFVILVFWKSCDCGTLNFVIVGPINHHVFIMVAGTHKFQHKHTLWFLYYQDYKNQTLWFLSFFITSNKSTHNTSYRWHPCYQTGHKHVCTHACMHLHT